MSVSKQEQRCHAILWWQSSSTEGAWERGIFLGRHANNLDK
jgi:hypothetical protein